MQGCRHSSPSLVRAVMGGGQGVQDHVQRPGDRRTQVASWELPVARELDRGLGCKESSPTRAKTSSVQVHGIPPAFTSIHFPFLSLVLLQLLQTTFFS